MIERIIHLMRTIVLKYDNKKPVYICTRPETRNRYKNDKYKIPFDEPQCPIFEDNRCCGGCDLASKCQHAVDCGCSGYTYARLGGNDKGYFMHKASMYYERGRLKNGKFDWPYYDKKKKKRSA